jgi:hypothetical protein
MTSIYEYYGRKWPLWITEFAPADWQATTPQANKFSRQQFLSFMKVILPWLESRDWIYGYSWFPFDVTCPQGTSSALFASNGRMNALGRYYASVTSAKPQGDQSIQFV